MDYREFLESKQKRHIASGFEIEDSKLNNKLFDFQKFCIKRALKAGKYALFEDCGLGKTFQQLEWAYQVSNYTKSKVLILAPLAVVQQTIEQGLYFDIDMSNIDVQNYEQLENIDCSIYSGIVLDESSILKNYSGATKQLILEKFALTPYKLACTATPSPNDHLELGNHAEFLDVMKSKDMVSTFFINDAFNKDHTISKWRLKKHAEKEFWSWVSSWALMLSKPSDIGFKNEGYDLPNLNIEELEVQSKKQENGKLFNDISVSATDFYKELRVTQAERCIKVAEIVNNSNENYIIWVKSNEEEEELLGLIPDALSVNGSHKNELKKERLLGFAKNQFRVLITKTKIAQYGLNYQNCRNQIFLSFDFSFEGLYQAIRRSWRFGQKNQVNILLVIVETMGNVIQSIKQKQDKFEDMQKQMQEAMNSSFENKENNKGDFITKSGEKWEQTLGDSTEYTKTIETESIDYSIFSPPFSDLFMYSDDPRDLSNNKTYEEFFQHFDFVIPELLRITKKGRLLTMHCTQLSKSIGRDGYLEIIDFRGDLIKAMQKHGWRFHAEVVIYKDPKIVAQRTKNIQLLHATTKKDSCVNRPVYNDYMITFKKAGENENPVNHEKNGLPFDYWCKIAEGVWPCGDIDAGDVINVKDAKATNDEKHLTPTQKEPLKRHLELYTNPNDLVYSPYSGAGTDGVVCLENNRRFKGCELKESYFNLSIKHYEAIDLTKNQLSLF